MSAEYGCNDLLDSSVAGGKILGSEENKSAENRTSAKQFTSTMDEASGQTASSNSGMHLNQSCSPAAKSGLNASQPSPNKDTESGDDLQNKSNNLNSADDVSEMIVGRSIKTRVLQKINGGSFGEIHLGILLETGEEVAVKLERQKSLSQQLLNEGNVLRHLEGGPGIPKVHWFGIHEPEYNVLVMDLLGPNLQDLFSYCKHRFTLKTVLMLADQMFDILKYIHKQQYVYRDVKPDNFMIGRCENGSKVYIIDFGLAKKMTSHRFSGGHSSSIVHPLVGTIRYASLHAHLGHEESPRDDLEGLAYVLIYFMRGRLPWQGIPAKNKEEKFAKIKEAKQNTSMDTLCKDLPSQFAQFLDTARQLRRESVIKYREIKDMFQNLARESNIAYDNQFDWIIRRQETGEEIEMQGRTDHGHDSS